MFYRNTDLLVSRFFFTGAALIGALLLFAPHQAFASDTFLTMTSQTGDYIGQGQNYSYSLSDSSFTATVNYSDITRGVQVRVENNSSSSDYWTLSFDAPENDLLQEGQHYDNAIRFPFNDDSAGLSVSGQHRGCNTLTGSFDVLQISVNAEDEIERFAADFVQHCEGRTPALSGSIRYNYESSDSDGDGISDAQETVDGTDKNDRGSKLPVLGTKVCAEWNGFLGGMFNIMEHVNLSNVVRQLSSSLYDIGGASQFTANFPVQSGAQYDLLVHDMEGRSLNSYGKVCSTHDGAKGDLDGRMVYYKTETSSADISVTADQFEFAFAMSFTNGHRGRQYVPFNTFQPSLNPAEAGNAVANWIQLTNLSESEQTGTMYFYDMGGALLANGVAVSLSGGARTDFSGHQFGANRVGIIEWRPENENIEFQLRNVRYYYDSSDVTVNSFVTASQFEGQVGSGRTQSVALDTNGSTAILEIANTASTAITADVKIYNNSGSLLDSRTLNLSAHASVHIITDSILNGVQGMATIKASASDSVIATAMHYGRDAFAGITYMYGIPAKEALGNVLRGTYNTYLAQGCTLFLTNPTSQSQTVSIGMVRSDGNSVLSGHEETVPATGLLSFDLCSRDQADFYGVVTVQPSLVNTITGTVVRIGENDQYRFPTDLRQ